MYELLTPWMADEIAGLDRESKVAFKPAVQRHGSRNRRRPIGNALIRIGAWVAGEPPRGLDS